jgi:hypothetical protein
MDATTCGILAAAMILMAGTLAYFEMALPSSAHLLPSQPVPGGRDANRETEVQAQSVPVNIPPPCEVCLIANALPHCEGGQTRS